MTYKMNQVRRNVRQVYAFVTARTIVAGSHRTEISTCAQKKIKYEVK